MNPLSTSHETSSAKDALFALILQLLERALDLAASADRATRLDELARLTADLDLFTQSAAKAASYD